MFSICDSKNQVLKNWKVPVTGILIASGVALAIIGFLSLYHVESFKHLSSSWYYFEGAAIVCFVIAAVTARIKKFEAPHITKEENLTPEANDSLRISPSNSPLNKKSAIELFSLALTFHKVKLFDKSYKLFDLAQQKDHVLAAVFLGDYCRKEQGGAKKKDCERFYTFAANKGNLEAQCWLILLDLDNKKYQEAFEGIKKTALQSNELVLQHQLDPTKISEKDLKEIRNLTAGMMGPEKARREAMKPS